MKIFPAIDIKDKKCVRLIKGNFDNKTIYKISPIEQAGKYKNGFGPTLRCKISDASGERLSQNCEISRRAIRARS